MEIIGIHELSRTTVIMSNEKYSRQSDIINADKLGKLKVTVIGIGAVGRQAALQLAGIGVMDLQLIDFDKIDLSNCCTQGYREEDIDKHKVLVTADDCRRINPQMTIKSFTKRYNIAQSLGGVVFCCVDNMDTRAFIYKNLENNVKLFIDSRMSAEVLRILTVVNALEKDALAYSKTLFPQSSAIRGRCTAKSTIYCANIAGALMVCQFTKWLRAMPLDTDFQYNLLSNEIMYGAKNESDTAKICS